MAHPKRRHSKTRRDKRRANDGLTKACLGVCPQCGAAVLSHRACSKCGNYKGRQVVVIKVKEKKAKK